MQDNNRVNNGHLYSKRDAVKIDWDKIPLSQYPRPQMVRDSYFCLNGKWDLAITKEDKIPEEFPLSVMVPFAVESPLSGVNHLLNPDEFLYYRKRIVLPKSFRRDKVILHFDGVDQIAEIYINGNLVFSHVGGYERFSFELPFGVTDRFELIVKVTDKTDASSLSRGKQVLNPGPYFYTSSSGIYKTVWLESVPRNYIESLRMTPEYDKKAVRLFVRSKRDAIAKITIGDVIYSVKTNEEQELKVLNFNPWSSERPYLYPVKIEMDEDVIQSYFGMRKIEIKEIGGFKRIYLNDQPIFLSGLLDQGYYPMGNLTPKSYREYDSTFELIKKYHFNCLRLHLKIESDIFYSKADKEGVLIVQDFPSGGENYRFLPFVLPRIFQFYNKEKNLDYEKMSRGDENGRKFFEQEIREHMLFLNNHPSVVIYTIFNEGWGEFDPSRIYRELKEIDPTRLYDTASGWYDADSDFFSIHTYSFPCLRRKNKEKRTYILSEVGGVGCKIENHSDYEGFFGHGKAKTIEKLEKKITKLYRKQLKGQIAERGLNMIIYTQLNDVEREYNGIMTFDRKVKKVSKDLFKALNDELYREFEDTVNSKGGKA